MQINANMGRGNSNKLFQSTAEYYVTLLHIRLLRHNELLDFYLDPGMTPSEAGYLF